MLNGIRFKARVVESLEKEFGCEFSALFEPNIANLVTLIKAGLGCDEAKAYDILDAELEKEDVDILEVMFTLMKAAQKCGFFPKKVNLLILQKQMESQILKMNTAMVEEMPEVEVENKFKGIE